LCVSLSVSVCAAGLSSLLSLIKLLFVFLLIENTLDLGRALTGLGSGVWGQTGGPVLRGTLLWSFLFSLQKSRLLGGPQGAAGSPLKSVPPRDDPSLPLSGGNLSPLLMQPLPSLQGCNIHTQTQASHQTATQSDEIHVQTQKSHTQPLFSLY